MPTDWAGWWCSNGHRPEQARGQRRSPLPKGQLHIETALPLGQRTSNIRKSRVVDNNREIIMAAPLPPQWVIDLNTPVPKTKTSSIPDPPGYTSSSITGKVDMPIVLLIIILTHSLVQDVL
jgi:hypothetical protein